jgi:hypothetical protein
MASSFASILQVLDLTAGASAIDYTPSSGQSPLLGFHCASISGGGTIKITPYRSTICTIGATSGSGGRLRISTSSSGTITGVEIAAPGSGYPANLGLTITLTDPFGSNAIIAATASAGGTVGSAAVVQGGTNYSGYIGLSFSSFVQGVSYDWVTRHIEQSGGTGSISLIGYKVGYAPFQVF